LVLNNASLYPVIVYDLNIKDPLKNSM